MLSFSFRKWSQSLLNAQCAGRARRRRSSRRKQECSAGLNGFERLEDRINLSGIDVGLSSGNLIITDATAGGTHDQLNIQLVSGSTIRITDASTALNAGSGTTQVNATTVDVPIGDITGSIQVNTLAGNDTLTLDLTGGDLLVPNGLFFDGGADSNSLSIVGGTTTSQAFSFTNDTDGGVALSGAITGFVTYARLESIASTVNAANVISNYSDVAETITMSANGGQTQLDSNVGGTAVSFNNPTSSLEIQAGSLADTANDVVTVNSFGAGLNAALTITGRGGLDAINLNASNLTAPSANFLAETISQTSAVSFGGTTTLDAGVSGSISLVNASNIFGTVAITNASTASLRDDGGMILGSSTVAVELLVQSAGAITQSGPLSGSGVLNKLGAGTLTLSAVNTFSGPAVVSGGTLRASGGSAIADTTAVQLNGGIFDLNGTSETVGGLFGATGSVTLGSGTLTVSPPALSSSTLTAPISGSGGSVVLNAPATATWTLAGNNTYTGATRVVSGNLKLSGAFSNNIANSSTIDLQTDATRTLNVTGLTSGTLVLPNGQTLTGHGRVIGNVTAAAGSSISPGTTEGILTLSGNLITQTNSTFVVAVNNNTAGTGYDQVDVTGTVSLGSAKLVTSGTIASSAGPEIVLINNDGTDAVSGTFNTPGNVPMPEGSTVTINGVHFILSYVGGVGGNDVTLTLPSDRGDAPTPYPTLAAENGARHTTGGTLRLGTAVDSEANGTHSANADADGADEDGVTFGTIRVGALGATATVNVAGGAGKLDAWIDFNGDGSWGGPGERIAASVGVVNGANSITFDVPSWAEDGTTFARFRLSTAGNLGPEGLAANGEVEDYAVTIIPPAAASGVFGAENTVTTGAGEQTPCLQPTWMRTATWTCSPRHSRTTKLPGTRTTEAVASLHTISQPTPIRPFRCLLRMWTGTEIPMSCRPHN
ncbi:MAG: GEVED domain-containing protein [Planctomycetaceae bacterium]